MRACHCVISQLITYPDKLLHVQKQEALYWENVPQRRNSSVFKGPISPGLDTKGCVKRNMADFSEDFCRTHCLRN